MDLTPLTLPRHIEAETSLLGCLLINGKLFNTVEGTGLLPDDFFEERNSFVFRAIIEINNEGRTPDVVTVSDQLSTVQEKTGVPDVEYLYEIANNAPVISEKIIKEYCNIIVEKALYRSLIKVCADSSENAYRQSLGFDEVVDQTTSFLIDLSNRRQLSTIYKLRDIVDEEMTKLKERVDSKQTISGISSGYPHLDSMCSGFKPGDMVVLAGRPGMGKTSFALNMAIEMARNGNNVLVFSLEMPRSQLGNRVMSIECSVNAKHLLTGKFEEGETDRLWKNMDSLSRLPIYIDDTSKLTVSDLRSRAKKLDTDLKKSGKNKKLDCIMVDYLQLMSSTGFRDDRVRQVEDISRNIKLFAKDMGIPIVALAQLNRKVEDRSTKIPMLSDLKDSGAIEQDADMVMFIHREDVYKQDSDKKNIADIFVQKNRHGQQGVVKLRFVPQYTKFLTMDNYSDDI